MGMLDPNPLIGIINGKFGDLDFVRTHDRKIIVRHRPVREAEFTGPELANQSLFARAVAYVQRIRQQPEQYAAYKGAGKAKQIRACDLAHADLRHQPDIRDVDLSWYRGQSGEVIRVQA